MDIDLLNLLMTVKSMSRDQLIVLSASVVVPSVVAGISEWLGTTNRTRANAVWQAVVNGVVAALRRVKR